LNPSSNSARPGIFRTLAYDSADEMLFGHAKYPVECGLGVRVGAGAVIPEVNYTLEPTSVVPANFPVVLASYRQMVDDILSRSAKLGLESVVLEFEHLPQLTENVDLGAQISAQTKEQMKAYHAGHGLKSALRATICDIRDVDKPPRMRTGKHTQTMFDSFRKSAEAGADLLAIESTGGKEVTDKAIVEADVEALIFGLGVLAPRDAEFLWNGICDIARATGTVASGDTACGFGNTAMILADQGFIPVALAAVIRAMTAVRTLVAHECGATGPTKDCGYEGPVIKAITGHPISMEGKSAACAHFSHVGNVAAAVCDLWSNESVQNVRLLAGRAPECFTEILAYDCRLLNEAIRTGQAKAMRDMLVNTDKTLSLHAFIICPEVSYEIAKAIVAEDTHFAMTRAAGLKACELMREAAGAVKVDEREARWLRLAESALEDMDTEDKVLAEVAPRFEGVVDLSEYGL